MRISSQKFMLRQLRKEYNSVKVYGGGIFVNDRFYPNTKLKPFEEWLKYNDLIEDE